MGLQARLMSQALRKLTGSISKSRTTVIFINQGLEKVERGLKAAWDKKTGVYLSYFINEVTQYEMVKDHFIIPKEFVQKPAVLFL